MIYKKITGLALLSTLCVSLSVVSLSALAAPKCLPLKAYTLDSVSKNLYGKWTGYFSNNSVLLNAGHVETTASDKISAIKVLTVYVNRINRASGDARDVVGSWICTNDDGNYNVGSGVTSVFTIESD